MLSPEQISKYRSGWQELRKKKKQHTEERYMQAMDRVYRAGIHLKKKYHCKVFLFGSLVTKDRFVEHSDIDIAVSGLSERVNFWQMYAEVMDILLPFDFDLVELEKIDPEVRAHITQRGVEL